MLVSLPAFAVGIGLIVKIIKSDKAGHGPAGLSVMIVRVTFPFVISVTDGV
jgi:hypothetical protein